MTHGLVLGLLAALQGATPAPPPAGSANPGSTSPGNASPGSATAPAGSAQTGTPASGAAPTGGKPQAQDPAAAGAAATAPAGATPVRPTAADPLTIPPEVALRIGSDDLTVREGPKGETQRTFYGLYYRERRGDYRLTMTPLTLDYERGIGAYGEKTTDYNHEALYGFLYYSRRSARNSADVLFPLAWHVRNDDSDLWALLPLLHREATDEHDNWVAPLMFEGKRKDSGYFHLPFFLTLSWYDPKSAFTLVGPFFRTRSFESVDRGLVPFFFGGDNHNEEGARRTYMLVPPLLFYNRYTELDDDRLTVAGPLVLESTPKRSIVDVLPLFFHIQGKPESGGVRESHTTLFPLFHVGRSDAQSLTIVPGYLRRETSEADTFLTPLYSYASTRRGASRTTAVGPIVPLAFWSRDKDTGASSLTIAPLFHNGHSPEGTSFLTPLFGRFETYGVSRRYWVLPTFTYGTDTFGWDAAFHPLVYVGRNEESSHAVVAPLYWDFKGKGGRTTLAIPLFWRFASTDNDSVTQVAANTLYMRKATSGGTDWQFHILPLASWGQGPDSSFWNVLFGLAGYSRDGERRTMRALWIPIPLSSGAAPSATALQR